MLFVEATAFPGDGKLQITGQLGDVMKESAAAALSYVQESPRRRRAGGLLSRATTCTCTCRPGAIPKDGPSAGITMATALASLLTGRPVRADTAMTGEITLTGQVLPIGGLKEKALAAQRAGIKRLIIPRRNEADIDDIPQHLRKRMKFVLVDDRRTRCSSALALRAKRRQAKFLLDPAPGRVQCAPASGSEESNGSKKKAAKAGAGAFAAGKAVRSNQYVQRLIEDAELRDEPAQRLRVGARRRTGGSTARARRRPWTTRRSSAS